MAIRLISDMHLCEARPDITRAFLHYLDQLPKDTEALYMLGDIFEIWIGDDDDSEYLIAIKTAIKKLTDSGIAVQLMHGNRDFLLGEKFAEETGATLTDESVTLQYDGERYLLLHGDTLCTDDTEYMQFRAQIRDPNTLNFLLSKPLAERREIAQGLREQSKAMSSNKASDIMDVNQAEVESVIDAAQTDYMIHGHTHRPDIHELKDDQYRTVLREWDKTGWEVVINEDGPELIQFDFPSDP